MYKVFCDGFCTGISLTLTSDSGNPDLFGEKFCAPNIIGRDCESCSLCRSRGGGSESCIVTSGNCFVKYVVDN